MSAVIALFSLILVVTVCSYVGCAARIWAPLVGVSLLAAALLSSLTWWLIVPCTLLYGAVCAITFSPSFRLRYFTKPVMLYIRKSLPAMSATEREALESGDVWWEGEIFSGSLKWDYLLSYPKATLTSAEQAFLDNQVVHLCEMLDDWQIIHETKDLPKQVWETIKRDKFFGMVIPKEYGGLGFSALAHSTIVSKIATRSVSAAVTVMVPNSLGPAELLIHYGTEAQKNYYLPRLASGQDIPCFALTAPEAGSDAASLPDIGIVCKGIHEGEEVVGIRLNWHKRYISLAPVATVIGLAFKLEDPDGLLGHEASLGITVCLIPTDHPGVEVGSRHNPLGLAFMNGPVRGTDVFIPLDWIIGGQEMAGAGWRMLMECLSVGRAISLPALSMAAGSLSYRMTGAYAAIRQQFNTPIGRFEGVGESLARIAGLTYILEAVRLLTVTAVDNGVKPAVASAMAKYHMTEMNRKIIEAAMDIHAGKGIQLGPRNYLAHAYFAVPLGITVEGANILTRNLIIFGQGAIRCHPFLRREMALSQADNIDEQMGEFDKLLLAHVLHIGRVKVRAFIAALTGSRLLYSPVKGKMAKYYRAVTRFGLGLAYVSDVTMVMLGGKLKRKERLSARLADVFSYLYLATATLKYYHDFGTLPEDETHTEWALQYCLYHAQNAFIQFFDNFPIPLLGPILKFVLFPLGPRFRAPSDKLEQQLADTMMQPSAFRDKLTQHCYVGTTESDVTGRVEVAFQKINAAKGAMHKIKQAVRDGQIKSIESVDEQMTAAVLAKIITDEEVGLLRDAELARSDMIAVDEFPQSESNKMESVT